MFVINYVNVFVVIFFGCASALIARTEKVQQQVAVPPLWQCKFTPNRTEVSMHQSGQVLLEISDVDTTQNNYYFHLISENTRLASINHIIHPNDINHQTAQWLGNITIDGVLLGLTNITVERVDTLTNRTEQCQQKLVVIVTRKMRVIDHVFTGSVATLVSLLYINFGAALDLNILRGIITRPIGPAIGFLTQFIMLPLLSYALGLAVFPNSYEMQLGLFFTGVSPAGGASNTWTVVLGGNMNLSILMTTIGNFAAFFMMPLWLFTLGKVIFDRAEMKVPYTNIASYAVALVVPLCIGLLIQKYLPRTTKWLVRLLKPISIILIVFIVIFAIVTNLYIFELFSWQIAVAGLALPWLGYLIAWIVAKILRQNSDDALTIAIETGIQNTGISIFLLRFSLPQPQADLTTVIPVAVAIMSPFPLIAIYIYRRLTRHNIETGLNERTSIMARPQEEQHSNIS